MWGKGIFKKPGNMLTKYMNGAFSNLNSRYPFLPFVCNITMSILLPDRSGNSRRQPMGTRRGVFCQTDADSTRKRKRSPWQDVHYGNYHP